MLAAVVLCCVAASVQCGPDNVSVQCEQMFKYSALTIYLYICLHFQVSADTLATRVSTHILFRPYTSHNNHKRVI